MIVRWRASLTALLALVAAGLPVTFGSAPLAPHQLVVVEAGGDVVITLKGYDLDGDALVAKLDALSASGNLYQLSKVFSDYGYEPKQGAALPGGVEVSGSKNRVYYKRPVADKAPVGAWGEFTYTVSDKSATSKPGMVTLVPTSGILVGSNFARNAEGWTITGNKAASVPVSYESSSRGLLNHYIYGTDDTIHTHLTAGDDTSLWYFQAPSSFLGHHGIAYGGSFDFVLSSFHGDFSADKLNTGVGSADLHLVVLHCAKCDTNRGVTIAFPLKKAKAFTGTTAAYSLSLKEGAGWVKSPKNSLTPWQPPTKCEFIELLSGLTSVKILGDFTTWYESVALDSVHLKNTKAQIPICAQGTPDASTCTC